MAVPVPPVPRVAVVIGAIVVGVLSLGAMGVYLSNGHGVPAATPVAGPVTLININTAPTAELEVLPGIGPAMAGRIIESREREGPFKTVEDLSRVKGIGPRTMERLRRLVTVE